MAQAKAKTRRKTADTTPPDAPSPEFFELLYNSAAPDDLEPITEANRIHVAEALWQTAFKREPGNANIKVFIPHKSDSLGWDEDKTVILCAHDDMPFLMDSMSAAVARYGITILSLIHPIMHVARDQKNRIVSVHGNPDQGTTPESLSVFILDAPMTEAAAAELESYLHKVLYDVRLATRDWGSMRDRVEKGQDQLEQAHGSSKKREEREEAQAFLQFLYEGNFTFLGYCYEQHISKDKPRFQDCLGVLTLTNRNLLSDPHRGLPSIDIRNQEQPGAMAVAKLLTNATVHRDVPYDVIMIRRFDPESGKLTGSHIFIGLFTSVTYNRSVSELPFIRKKAEQVIAQAGYPPDSHDAKALGHILEKYPRDELFQIRTNELLEIARNIRHLQRRRRASVFTRHDPYKRYVSCLVYVPRERFETRLRLAIQTILMRQLQGECISYQTTIDDSPLARILFIITAQPEQARKLDVEALEDQLAALTMPWREWIRTALTEANMPSDQSAGLSRRYARAFSQSYTERARNADIVEDLTNIEMVLQALDHGVSKPLTLDLYKRMEGSEDQIGLKIYYAGQPLPLSQVLPVLENMGMSAVSELPHRVEPLGAPLPVYIHDFSLRIRSGEDVPDLEAIKHVFETTFLRVWHGIAEDDPLNALSLEASLQWHSITVLRACVRYLRQLGVPFSRRYIENTLVRNPQIAAHLSEYFTIRHDPTLKVRNRHRQLTQKDEEIETCLADVMHLDEDRILRMIQSLLQSSLRTNFFQRRPDGQIKPYLAIKFATYNLTYAPRPRPWAEIYVYAPEMEAVHLRGGPIARGGIRWSDRFEDFRTEVLGLMKAQMVKNAVIVPVGAKGGFVLKDNPRVAGMDFKARGIQAYQTMIRGMLDITDNKDLGNDSTFLKPEQVVCHDGDDAYLVVAADKGTAGFSDIANALAHEYDFWLGDAFASGGSYGYDHKEMGITARGAWQSVRQHFFEKNIHPEKDVISVVGVGDMAGDVFGNGMLCSKNLKLIAAFNHKHIFVDPDPDPQQSFRERQRLFRKALGWDHYNKDKLSGGGCIFNRTDKSLELTPEIQSALNLKNKTMQPHELIRAILKAQVDLMWFGGIGTYVKASQETHLDVGDKSNDFVRINATDLRAGVIAEGANLAMTLASRVEFASLGGRINTDFIDNVGGVDSSDREVNIKILLNTALRQLGAPEREARNKLLTDMTEGLAELVLEDARAQNRILSMTERECFETMPVLSQFIRDLERERDLDRTLEGLPDDETLEARIRDGNGLFRPELAVLLSYAKMQLTESLLESEMLDDRDLALTWLSRYYPDPLSGQYQSVFPETPLRREILATVLANYVLDHLGPAFVKSVYNQTGARAEDSVRAFLNMMEVFSLKPILDEIENPESPISKDTQLDAMGEFCKLAARTVPWFIFNFAQDKPADDRACFYRDLLDTLRKSNDAFLPGNLKRRLSKKTEDYEEKGLSKFAASDLARLNYYAECLEPLKLAVEYDLDPALVARLFYLLGQEFTFPWLRAEASMIRSDHHLHSEAARAIIDDLYHCQAEITHAALRAGLANDMAEATPEKILKNWLQGNQFKIDRIRKMLNELKASAQVDTAMLGLAEKRLRTLAQL